MSHDARPLFSSHLAHVGLSQSWRHALAELEAPPAPSEVMEIGDVAHQVILEQDVSRVAILDFPDWRTKVARDSRDAVRAAGKTPILAHKWATVEAMVTAVRAQLRAFDPVPFAGGSGQAEQSLYFTAEGVQCRATPDWLTLDTRRIWDLKTTGTAHPAVFSRTLWDKGYHLQAALYRRAVFTLFGVLPEFEFVVVETAPPYALSIVGLDPEALVFANTQLDTALAGWKRCLETNVWPAYPTRPAYAEVPPYLLAQWEARAYYIEETSA